MMVSPPRIAIIGAGPAGLTLARLLHVSQAKLDISIYERDASATARDNQGGTLDLHEGTGLTAIRKCGLWDSFQRHARYDGDEKIMADKNCTIIAHMGGSGSGNRPEIDRFLLKEILLESVPESCMRWGRHLKEVTEDGRLKFDGREEVDGPFDLIIGADGAWSKVRARVTDQKPHYSGVSGYEMEIKKPAETCPHVDKMIGKGGFLGVSERKFLNAQRMGDKSLKVRSWFTCPEGEASQLLEKEGKEKTRQRIYERYAGWAPEMTEFFKQADIDTLRHWTCYELPVGCKWEHKQGFTLVGDSVSLATPFSGEGVNKAMTDSLELADLIIKSQDQENDLTLDQAVSQYEQGLFPRSRDIQATTMSNKQIWFGSESPAQAVPSMIRSMTSKSPSILIRMIGPPGSVLAFGYIWVRQQIGWLVRRFWRQT